MNLETALVTQKLRSLEELQEIVLGLRAEGKTCVWANGCFEILHAGHIEFLLRAAKLGDVLIVGVNSDESVRQLKGAAHPLAALEERVLVLSAVAAIQYITVFDGPTCAKALAALKPEVYAKGLNHLRGGINEEERALVEASRGAIALIGGDPAKSTEAIIDRVRKGAAR